MRISNFFNSFQTSKKQNAFLSDIDWPEPQPLRNTLIEVTPLPLGNIPKPYQDWISDVAERMQCPIDFVAVAAIVATASIIGTSCGIKPKQKDDWLVIPNLWGGIVGRPGMLKTPAVSEVIQIINQLEIEEKKSFDAQNENYLAEIEIARAEKEAIKSAILNFSKQELKHKTNDSLDALSWKEKLLHAKEPQKPIWKRYKTNDATIEKLCELLADNPRGLLLYRDELMGLLSTWNKEGREGDRAFFLEAWNGNGSHTTDRITRGTVYTENLCISIFGSTQPAKLSRYLHHAIRSVDNDGLLQRFQLLIYPDQQKNWKLIDRTPNHQAKQRATTIFKKLRTMNAVEYGATQNANDRFPYFRYGSDAQDIFYCWLEKLECKQLQNCDDHPILLEHLSKYRSLVPSISLIFHLIKVADGKLEQEISSDDVLCAIGWSGYLEKHARRIYGMLNTINREAAIHLSKKIQTGELKQPFSVRDIYRKEWALLDEKEIVQKACDELSDAGWIRQELPSYEFGRPKLPTYVINPKLKIFSDTEENFF